MTTDTTAGKAVTAEIAVTGVNVTDAIAAAVMTDAETEITIVTENGTRKNAVTEIIAVTETSASTKQCITIGNAGVKETAITIKTGDVNAPATAAAAAITKKNDETGIK